MLPPVMTKWFMWLMWLRNYKVPHLLLDRFVGAHEVDRLLKEEGCQ